MGRGTRKWLCRAWARPSSAWTASRGEGPSARAPHAPRTPGARGPDSRRRTPGSRGPRAQPRRRAQGARQAVLQAVGGGAGGAPASSAPRSARGRGARSRARVPRVHTRPPRAPGPHVPQAEPATRTEPRGPGARGGTFPKLARSARRGVRARARGPAPGRAGLTARGSRAGVPSAPPTPERRGPYCARGAAPAPGPARDGGEGPAGRSRAPLTCGRAARSRGRSARSRRRARARAAAGDAIFAKNPRGGREAGRRAARGGGVGGLGGGDRGRRGGTRGRGAGGADPAPAPPLPRAECGVRAAQGRGRPVGEPLAPLRGARSPRSPGSGPEAPRPPVPSGGCRGCSCEQKRVPSLRPWGSHRPGPRTRAVSPRAGLADLPQPRPGTSACPGCLARRRGRA